MPELKKIANIKLELVGTELQIGTEDHEIEKKGHMRHVAEAPFYEGVVTSATYASIDDSTAYWTLDEYIGKMIMVKRGQEIAYGLINDNGAQRLVLESNLAFLPEAGDSYVIMDTLTFEAEDLSLMLVVDTSDHPMGIVLPEASEDTVGYYLDAYMEAGDNPAAFCHTGTGLHSFIALEHAEEGIRLVPSINGESKWNLVLSQGVKRIGEGYWSAQEAVGSASFVPVGANLNIDLAKRFADVLVDGIHWLKYTSVMTTDFLSVFIANVYKSGSVGELDITIAHKDGVTGIITYKDSRLSSSRFGAGEGEQTVIVEVPLVLKRGDMVAASARRSSGTLFINHGSTLRVMEV